MSSPSNLYAEKIFSEHPLAFWALDDSANYISLINDTDRDLSQWDDGLPESRSGVYGGTATNADTTNEPFSTSPTTMLTGEVTQDPFGQITCISNNDLNTTGINFSSLDSGLATFAIGSFFYTDSAYLAKIDIGYEYFDVTSGENVEVLKSFNTSVSGRWIFLAETFDIPNDNTTIRLVIKVSYSGGSNNTDDYRFFVNGLSLGQWSEEFNSTSLGSSLIQVPSNILESTYGIEAKSYGLQSLPGYYLANSSKSLTAKNSGIPMVYGSSNVTILSPNSDKPSLIIPGNGFLNNDGKYSGYTCEFWISLSCDSIDEKRIFGPIASLDGLYVRGPFITLKIGNFTGTHYVGEWLRPMLLDIRYTPTSATLMINGELVISLSLITDNISFPNKLSDLSMDQDWLGFYCHEDVPVIQIDCIAIYPYQVSEILAKRRFVYGQGVEFPENINTAYSGTSIFIDYPFANYANNYSYPDFGKWNQGIMDNLISEKNILSIPNYTAPSINFNNKTQNSWIEDLSVIQDEQNNFISLKPNTSWNNTEGYILIDSLNITKEDMKCFYGVFKQNPIASAKEILFEIQDTSNLNYLQIFIQDYSIIYTLKYGSEIVEIYRSQAQYTGEIFSAGIDINKFIQYFGNNLPSFFGKKSSLKLYVGGNNRFENTFTGKIYSIGICSARNFSKISNSFNDKGLCLDNIEVVLADGMAAETSYWDELYDGDLASTNVWEVTVNPDSDYLTPVAIANDLFLNFIATYTVKLNKSFDTFSVGISTDSYWEDYIPLTYLAKYTKDAEDTPHYSLDFIQFNISYPAPSVYSQATLPESWTYQELLEEYSVPSRRTYESLDNSLFTGYQNYNDLKNKSKTSYKYDTSKSLIKTYVSFQYLAAGANSPDSYFTNKISPDKNGIVVPGSYIIGFDDFGNKIYDSFENTKYEVIDNMIIYPPNNVDFNELAIVTHIEFSIDGIENNPLKIKKIQYSSQALNDTTPNAIGTRFGTKLYPYKKSGVYYDYKSSNPFSIYKGSSPYLYLTRNSGIQLRGNYDPLINRGIQIPINESKSAGYKVIASQMAIRYDEDFFPYAPTEILQIQSKKSIIKFYLVSNHPQGKRAKIYAVNTTTGRLENGISFYWNGKLVKEPTITIKEWGMLGIGFSNSLNFDKYAGSLNITGPLIVNSISHYKSTNLQEVQQVTNRPWFRVKAFGNTEFDWDYWNASYIWNGVLVLASTSYYGVSPEDIYKTYTGTNKIIIDDDVPITLKSYEYRLLNEVIWQSDTITPV